MKRLMYLICFFAIGFNLYSESVFTYDLKKDIPLVAVSAAVFLSPFIIDVKPGNLPSNLDRNDVNVFDRRFMFSDGSILETIASGQKYSLLALPIITPLAVAGWDIRNDFNTWLTYGIMYAQAVALTHGTVNIIKNSVERYRPRVYFSDHPSANDNSSFPSGSTAMAFMGATFLNCTFSAEYPDSPWKIPIIVGSNTLAVSVGISRITSGKHFLTDVLAGAALGSFYGWLMPTLHRRTNHENRISFYFTGNGGLISLKL